LNVPRQGAGSRLRRGANRSESRYALVSLRHDLSKRRAKRLVDKLRHSRRHRLLPTGYSICLVFFKLFARV
jgi:hypothetical protein